MARITPAFVVGATVATLAVGGIGYAVYFEWVSNLNSQLPGRSYSLTSLYETAIKDGTTLSFEGH